MGQLFEIFWLLFTSRSGHTGTDDVSVANLIVGM